MIKKLVIIFALIYAFHGVVNGSEIKSDDRKKSPESPEINLVPCIFGYYNGMYTHCALTGKLYLRNLDLTKYQLPYTTLL